MGFGFSLYVVFILFPSTIVLTIIWLIKRKWKYGRFILFAWAPIFLLLALSLTIKFFTTKKTITRDDVYGEYVIDRTKFSGKQANWQYNRFRFEITKQNDFIFYLMKNGKIIKTYHGATTFIESYSQPRIVLGLNPALEDIIEEKPTLYRAPFSFYYVFNSPKFGNMFFVKGQWKQLNK